MAQYSLGIDIGGTFTDLVVYDHDTGARWSRKVLTTHDDPARAVAAGVAGLLGQARVDPAAFSRVVHATTLFTNALIERKGAVTGLITTAGFADTLEIGRERKYELYDLAIAKPEPLVPRHLRLEVPERTKADGRIARRLDTRAVAARAAALARAGVGAIAVVFLHAYANPRHEREAARLIARRHPGVAVTTSHEVAPEIREYERASTTVANAYIKPLAQQYLALMAERVAALGIPAPLLLMLSSGGLTHVAEAQRVPVQMLESGPAAGAIAAAFFGQADGDGRVLAFDMGGTTAKLSLVDGGEPLTAYSFEAARQRRFIEGSGLPIRISTIELIEIGAGGGSIAPVDEIGLLKVGPAQRRLAAGAGLLRPGRARAHRDRRRLPARLPQPGLLRGRRGRGRHGGRDRRDRGVARRARARVHQGRVGHPRHRQREHGQRGARAHRRARARPARLRAALHRRRGAGARLLGGPQARHRPRDLPAVGRRGLGPRPAGGAGARRPRGHRGHPARSREHRRARGRLRAARGRRRAR